MEQLSPEKLADASKPGEQWLAEHGDALYRFALRSVGRQTAEDLVQETLLAALVAQRDFSGASSEQTWLIGILKHKLVDHFRTFQRMRPLSRQQSTALPDLFDKHGRWTVRVSMWRDNPLKDLEKAEFAEVLRACMAKLPPRTARLFWLREGQGMKTEDLCKELEITPTNFWTLMHRARVSLHRCLSINWFENGEE